MIDLKNVSYKYPGRKKVVLKDISLKIKKGKKIGIMALQVLENQLFLI